MQQAPLMSAILRIFEADMRGEQLLRPVRRGQARQAVEFREVFALTASSCAGGLRREAPRASRGKPTARLAKRWLFVEFFKIYRHTDQFVEPCAANPKGDALYSSPPALLTPDFAGHFGMIFCGIDWLCRRQLARPAADEVAMSANSSIVQTTTLTTIPLDSK